MAVLAVSLIALSACTAAPEAAPPTALTSLKACSEHPCHLPNGGRPLRRIPFPDIQDWSSLRITLERSLCMGPCPAYRVTIAGDGTVTWHGEYNVKVKRDAVAKIAPEKVRALYEAFRTADFFWLFDEYILPESADAPGQITTIAFDGHSKMVNDYLGCEIGMPGVVNELEDAIDEAANTAKWIGPGDHFYGTC